MMQGTDEGFLIEKLRAKKLTLTSAESCTGGLLGAVLTGIPGASEVYLGGVISYSNQVKSQLLNVAPLTLETFGAVSAEVASEMAHGARLIAGANLGVGITGIAGPDGGSEAKPVGLVYIAVESVDKKKVTKCSFAGNRSKIRYSAVKMAIKMLNALLDGSSK